MIDRKRLESIKSRASSLPEPTDVLVLELIAEIESLQATPMTDMIANMIYQHEFVTEHGAPSIVQWFALSNARKDDYRDKARQTAASFGEEQIALKSEADMMAMRRGRPR